MSNSRSNNKSNKNGFKLNGILKILLIYLVISVVFTLFYNVFFNPYTTMLVPYSQFVELGERNVITNVQISSSKIYFETLEGEEKKSYATEIIVDEDILRKLKSWGVKTYSAVPVEKSPIFEFIVSWILPMLLFFFMFRFLSKMMQSRMPKSLGGIGKSNIKEYDIDSNVKVRFDDVAGQDEAKESLLEIVDYLHNPDKYRKIGAKLPKGELLVGPPGTGKTLLAKAVAGEAGVPFFSISGSEFIQMFVGMGASRVRELFQKAKEKAPCIIFIDEIDAIGKARDSRGIGGNDEREQTLNQLLTEMDGFDSNKNVIVVLAATNRPEILDPALLRPGRFDRRVIVNKPDFEGRKKILQVHMRDVNISEDVNIDSIARMTSGCSGADLANIINEAALRSVRQGLKEVGEKQLKESVEVIFAGEAKKDRIMTQDERFSVAYHEAGHAIAGAMQAHADPVAKITIVPTTMGALGYTLSLPNEEKYLVSKDEMMDKIVVILAGRAAEEVKLGQISTGAANDIEKATQMARQMITMYGMSERFDMVGLEKASSQYLSGQAYKLYSDATGKEIDEEVLKIIKSCHERAKKILTINIELLDEVSNILLEKETIDGEEFYALVKKYNKLI